MVYVKSLKLVMNDIQDLLNYLDRTINREFSDAVAELVDIEAGTQALEEIDENEKQWESEMERKDEEHKDKITDIRDLLNDLEDLLDSGDIKSAKKKILVIRHNL